MTPVAHWTPEMGAAAIRRAHRAWANSQPQYVIPGVLEQVDAGTGGVPFGVDLLEPALSSLHSPNGAGSTPHERRNP